MRWDERMRDEGEEERTIRSSEKCQCFVSFLLAFGGTWLERERGKKLEAASNRPRRAVVEVEGSAWREQRRWRGEDLMRELYFDFMIYAALTKRKEGYRERRKSEQEDETFPSRRSFSLGASFLIRLKHGFPSFDGTDDWAGNLAAAFSLWV